MSRSTADVASITRRLEKSYQSFAPQLRKAARYVVKAPTEVALYSLREVAARAEVGPTTLVRLAEQLGFPSYNAFRVALASHCTGSMAADARARRGRRAPTTTRSATRPSLPRAES